MIDVDSILVSFSTNHKDNDILVVARKHPNKEPDIINAFEGSEARKIYEKLIGKEA